MIAKPDTFQAWQWWSGLAVGLVVASGCFVATGFPAPQGDDAVYKSPGAEWVEHGRLAVPALTGLLATANDGFAHYPPLYPLTYGVWYGIWGFSLTTTLAASFGIHLLHCLLVGLVAHRLLDGASGTTQIVRMGLVTGCILAAFANCAFFDRPEELGLCWVWIGYWKWGMSRSPNPIANFGWWGAIVGVAALTAPYSGLLGALLVVGRVSADLWQADPFARRAAQHRGTIQLLLAGGVSATMAAAWMAVVEWRNPGILQDQLFSGSLAFVSGIQPLPWLDRVAMFPRSLLFHPPQLPVALMVLVFLPIAWLQRELRSVPSGILWGTMAASLVLVALIRPTAYTYVGASLMLATPLFGLAASRYVTGNTSIHRGTGWLVVVLCVSISGRDDVRHLWEWHRIPLEYRSSNATRRLRKLVPAGETVAVTPRHWYVFQGRNPWRDAFLSALRTDEEIRRCRWLVLDPEVGNPPYLEYFEPVEPFTAAPAHRHSYAFRLWRHRTDP